jgi:hypothetical protein
VKTALPNPLYESENRTPAALTKISVEKGPAALFKKISQHLGKWCGRPMQNKMLLQWCGWGSHLTFNDAMAGDLKFLKYPFNKGRLGISNLRDSPLIMVRPVLSINL